MMVTDVIFETMLCRKTDLVLSELKNNEERRGFTRQRSRKIDLYC